MCKTHLHSSVGVYRDTAYSWSQLLPQQSWDSDENKALTYELLVKTHIFYFVFVITIYFNEFCTTTKCEQHSNHLSTTLKQKTAVFYANDLNCIIKYVDNKYPYISSTNNSDNLQ